MFKMLGMWQPISTAPMGRALELAVIDDNGEPRSLVFPCRRVEGGWSKTEAKSLIDVRPTHWRDWGEKLNRIF